MAAILSAICGSFLAGWILGRALRPRSRRGSNPPPPDRKPPAPACPTPSSARLIGYFRWVNEQNEAALNGWQPIRLDEGRVQRGNGKGGPATPKPAIIPKPQPPPGRVVDVHGMTIGYITFPRSWGSTPSPPPSDP